MARQSALWNAAVFGGSIRLPIYVFSMIGQVLDGGNGRWVRRQSDSLAMERVVVPAVLELFPDSRADNIRMFTGSTLT